MENEMAVEKRYLGDGVYISVERGMLRLSTENGMSVTNEIFLESEVLINLLRYMKDLKIDIMKFIGN